MSWATKFVAHQLIHGQGINSFRFLPPTQNLQNRKLSTIPVQRHLPLYTQYISRLVLMTSNHGRQKKRNHFTTISICCRSHGFALVRANNNPESSPVYLLKILDYTRDCFAHLVFIPTSHRYMKMVLCGSMGITIYEPRRSWLHRAIALSAPKRVHIR